MQVTSHVSRVIWAVLFGLILAPVDAGAETPLTIELWHRGDDALSVSFRSALERAITSSKDLRLASGDRKSDITIRIPNHVEWRRRLWRTQVIYSVGFYMGAESVGTSRGTCPQTQITRCASAVVVDLRRSIAEHRNAGVDDIANSFAK